MRGSEAYPGRAARAMFSFPRESIKTRGVNIKNQITSLPATDVQPGIPDAVRWIDHADRPHLRLLDQTLLPAEISYRNCATAEEVHLAIRQLCVRGAPAIGVAAAYGLCLGTFDGRKLQAVDFENSVRSVGEYLKGARPTAVNLAWAIDRILKTSAAAVSDQPSSQRWTRMLDEARRIHLEELNASRRIGEHGAGLIRDGCGVLTHCNAGALATVGYGTALAPLYVAHEEGRKFRVYADETRPLLQGARLTAFELHRSGIEVTVLCEGAAAGLMASGVIDRVIVGADRIAANGDTANKVGTYSVAIASARHGIPFYVAAPHSTFDLQTPSGASIPIEQRDRGEIAEWGGKVVVPAGVRCYNPAFDVTPAELIRGFITPKGILEPVSEQKIREFLC